LVPEAGNLDLFLDLSDNPGGRQDDQAPKVL
jgi:hypothetical protein